MRLLQKKFIKEQEALLRYVPLTYSLMDVCKALFLFARRAPALFKELNGIHPVATSWYFANFCSAYSYLCYFHRVLMRLDPEFVITANDHNVSNRCMLAVAHHLGIKTVYLQHASVSNLFPALRVNYAFLDGQSALETYRECEENQPSRERKVPLPKVLLTGQKKHLAWSDSSSKIEVGVLNALDDAREAINLVQTLADEGLSVLVRWHPGKKRHITRLYVETLTGYPVVSLSDPKAEPVSDFMGKIGYLIAGNSSIHLEAALAGVLPIYYELTPADKHDYYGYLKNGLSKLAKSSADILNIVKNTKQYPTPVLSAVRYYSATYLSRWDSREGELVAEYLSKIAQGKELILDLEGYTEIATSYTVGRLKEPATRIGSTE